MAQFDTTTAHEDQSAPQYPTPMLRWWVLLVIGVGWLLFGMVILQLDITSARAIAVAAGLLLVVAALSQLVDALAVRSHRWLHLALAAVFFVGGIVAMVWPDPTFVVLAQIVAWLLLFKGIANVVTALFVMPAGDGTRWLLLVLGLAEIAVAFWAAGVPSRSATLLALWVGLVALGKGVTDIALAVGLRSQEHSRRAGSVPG